MAYFAGDTIVDDVNVADGDQNPSALPAEAVFTTVAVVHSSGAAVTPVLVTATATPGQYLVSWVAPLALPGAYTLTAVAAETGETYTQTYDVEPVSSAGLIPGLGAPGITLGDFRALLANRLLDYLRLTATADGDTSTFFDVNHLTDGDDAYASSQGKFIAALAPDVDGAIVTIDGSSASDASVTFRPSIAGNTHTGDILDLFNLGGYGFRIQQYDLAIREAIAVSWRRVWIDHAVEVVAPFTQAVPLIPIPRPFIAVHTLEINEAGDQTQWREVPMARRAGRWGEGWTVDKAQRQIRLDGDFWRWTADGYGYRLRGYARQEPPVTDNDLIVIDVGWLLDYCASRLAGRRVADSEWSNWAIEWGRQAEQRLEEIKTNRHANTVFVP